MKTFKIKLTAEFDVHSSADSLSDLQHDIISHMYLTLRHGNTEDIWEALGIELGEVE